jgi:hypothetical protein
MSHTGCGKTIETTAGATGMGQAAVLPNNGDKNNDLSDRSLNSWAGLKRNYPMSFGLILWL